jgi:hypothetical protein
MDPNVKNHVVYSKVGSGKTSFILPFLILSLFYSANKI